MATTPNPFLMRTLLRFFFYLLYHPFAFAYDLVAATVSLGRWKDWVLSVVPFIEGNSRSRDRSRTRTFAARPAQPRDCSPLGLDESAPMGRLAKRNLRRSLNFKRKSQSHVISSTMIGYTKIKLTRGVAQHLPFPAGSFDTIVATFPCGIYLRSHHCRSEAMPVLIPGGRFIVLPAVRSYGTRIHGSRYGARVSHHRRESSQPLEILHATIQGIFRQV